MATKNPKRPARRLHSGHFAFMRALAQGLDQRASGDPYLRLKGDASRVTPVLLESGA